MILPRMILLVSFSALQERLPARGCWGHQRAPMTSIWGTVIVLQAKRLGHLSVWQTRSMKPFAYPGENLCNVGCLAHPQITGSC